MVRAWVAEGSGCVVVVVVSMSGPVQSQQLCTGEVPGSNGLSEWGGPEQQGVGGVWHLLDLISIGGVCHLGSFSGDVHTFLGCAVWKWMLGGVVWATVWWVYVCMCVLACVMRDWTTE
jgi:hypothetical protein